MSKYNAVRIVNLNYNKNTMKINDETFNFGGESTLMSLRNGGGKSVMVQMLMAPFLNARYRDLKDRKFSSYFTGSTPTYILTEWILDNNSSYVLTGMGIKRKTTTSDGDSKDELDIITFIHEYKEGNDYDIHNFPVTEKTSKGFKVKNFSYLKNKMEEIKGDKNYIFDYFDLGIDAQRRKYFETLKQYNINHREWESIIKKINLKESGLSDLFQEAKTVSGLVEKWFIPTVSDKLNDGEDKIKNFGEIIQKFIVQYKENENKMQRREGIELFKNKSIEILKKAEDFKSSKEYKEKVKNEIANFYNYLCCEIENLISEKENMENRLISLNEEFKEIEYERLSFEYHKLNEDIRDMQEEKSGLEKVIDELDSKINDKEIQIAIEECAKSHRDYMEYSKQVQTYENKLDIARSKDSEKENERKHIGYTLRKHYEYKIQGQNQEALLKGEEKRKVEGVISELNDKFDRLNKECIRIAQEKASLQTKVEGYNEEEFKFNEKYALALTRDIAGEYDGNIIENYEENFKKRCIKNHKEFEDKVKELDNINKELPIKRKEKEETSIKYGEIKNSLENNKKELEVLEKAVDDIKKVLLYCNIEDSKVFDKEYILKQLTKKIESLNKEKQCYIENLHSLEKEKKMYETGRNIKLQEEFEEMLSSLDIPIVFGLEWIKKQNLSMDKKTKLINNNPFLPYSLIMQNSSLEKLKREETEVFTSFPLPIIEQEKLESTLQVQVVNNIYTVGNMDFYIAFNSKLLNEEELKALLKDLSLKIEDVNKSIGIKEEEINAYALNKYKVAEFNVKKSYIDNLNKSIKQDEKNIISIEDKISLLIDRIHKLEEDKNQVEKSIKHIEYNKDKLEREKEDFNYLMKKYNEYKEQKDKLLLKGEELTNINERIEELNDKVKSERNLLENVNEQMRILKDGLNESERQCKKYIGFRDGEIIKKDIEDLEGRYEAISSGIGAEVKDLENILSTVRGNFKNVESQLIEKTKEYNLKESDYINVIYDNLKEGLLKKDKKELQEGREKNKKTVQELEIKKAKKEANLEITLKNIKENFQTDIPKDKIYIQNLDFKGRKNSKNKEINQCRESIIRLEDNIVILKSNKDKMHDYAEFKVQQNMDFTLQLNNIEEMRKELIEKYHISITKEEQSNKILSKACSELSDEVRFTSDEFFRNTIDILLEINSNPEDVIKTLGTVREVHMKMLQQLETDLAKVEEEKKNIMDMLYEYMEQVYENLGMIDDNSSININGRYIKMLNIIQPKWEDKKEYYKLKIKDFLESIIERCVQELSQGKNIEETISKEITTIRLYDEVVGISEIDIKLYKIEASKQVQISWNGVAENSGGEGFLSAFVILTSLLSYMRKEETDIFRNSQEGKVLIMDNPFAQTNAEHLLKPLMDIAKKNNTQLICFSGLGGDSIYNRFDNIYVLNLMDSKLNQGMYYMESEHKKGEELTNVVSSRFKIQKEIADQITLF
ncbi:Chromosome partition protein Smc [Clostridium liquoris]|uniref:Chromosome partition protein Smc n=1 Tax=Clostridium liquoris TaxID=1289519 RepID=A0A2T0B715_9CLOT|nr:hypothetical protein [Clostridium liquoris]PRR79681.1 Chromosome partition protein Smc [Clostridium liquoris]